MKSNGKSNGHDHEAVVPFNVEAERAVLGALLLDTTGGAYAQAHELKYTYFHLPSHRNIYRRMVELHEAGQPLNFITLGEQLMKHKELQTIGGDVYLTSLTDGLPRVRDIGSYVQIVKEKAMLRMMMEWGEQTIKAAAEPRAVAEDIIRDAELKLGRLRSWATPKGTTAESTTHLLNDVCAFIRKYVVLTESQTTAITLWTLHTHSFKAADTTPYLSVTSAEKQSGKTRLLEVMTMLVNKPWLTARTTAAVLPRKIEADRPTLLLDETDAALKSGDEYCAALIGILNSGYRYDGTSTLCSGQGANIKPQEFSTFCPKAIAGIGTLPDTVADRSIPIRLKRKSAGEKVLRFRRRDLANTAKDFRNRLAAWASANIEQLHTATPELPEQLSDRQQECIEPLLAIADTAEANWPERARAALIQLCTTGAAANDQSIRVQLLADIQMVFSDRPGDQISSEDLVQALNAFSDHPWVEFSHGKALTQRGLARLLTPFEISPRRRRIGEQNVRGYAKADFGDAFVRYLGVEVEQAEQVNVHAGETDILEVEQKGAVPLAKTEESPLFMRAVPLVPDKPGYSESVDEYEQAERLAIMAD